MVLTEGWDMPEVSCCILARPTRKMGLYRQMVGRVLRPAPGKTNAIVLDHSGAVFRHGFVEDHVDWTLDPEKRAESPTHAARLRSGYPSRLSNAPSAARSASPAKPASTADSFRSGRRRRSRSGTATSPWSTAPAVRRAGIRSERAHALARHAHPHRRRARL